MTEEKIKKAEFKISGMSCAMCAKTIENFLLSLDGVISAQVDLGSEKAFVRYDSNKLRIIDLEKTIKSAGYEVIGEKAILKIGGMSCVSCINAVKNSLRRLDGIIDVNVNFNAGKAYITYNSKVTTLNDIKRTIEETGYQYLGIEKEKTRSLEEEVKKKSLKEKLNRIIVGFATGIVWGREIAATPDCPKSRDII